MQRKREKERSRGEIQVTFWDAIQSTRSDISSTHDASVCIISGAYEPPKAARSVQLRIIAAFAFTVARSFYHKRITEIFFFFFFFL